MMRTMLYRLVRYAFPSALLVAVGACGGGSSSPAPMTTYTISGMVAGLAGSGLVLHNNSGGDLAVSTAGEFTFTAGLATGAAYAVTVKTQPSTQNCVVTNGSGTVGTANVTNVTVECTAATYNVSGTVTGLKGSGLILQYKRGIATIFEPISGAGHFAFIVGLLSGSAYALEVRTQPSSPAQHCVITNGSGTIGTVDVTNVAVVCADVGRFAYAGNAGDNTISVYSIDSTTGALAAVGTPVATGTSPYAIVGSPDGQHLYVGNRTSNNISAYAVNASSGALTPISGSPIAAGTDPQALAFDPSGAYLYVANNGSNNLSAYSVNASTGALTPLTTPTYATGIGPSAVSVDSSGMFVYVANNGGSNDISVFALTAGTGALTPVAGSPFAAGDNPHSLVLTPFSPFDYGSETFLYTANFNGTSSTISGFTFDTSTGALTALRGSPFAVGVSNYFGMDRTGAYLYVTTGASVVGYSIDATTGLLSALAGFPVASGANGYSVTVDPSNQFLYVGNDGAASISGYRLDAATGGLTPIPGSPFAAGNRPDFIAIL